MSGLLLQFLVYYFGGQSYCTKRGLAAPFRQCRRVVFGTMSGIDRGAGRGRFAGLDGRATSGSVPVRRASVSVGTRSSDSAVLRLQCELEDLAHVRDKLDTYLVANLFRQVLQHVLSIALRHDDGLDAGSRAPRAFSLIPPIGSTRPESVTSPVIAEQRLYHASAEERCQRRGHRDARRRPILRNRARWHVDMDVVLLIEVRRRSELLRMRPHKRQRGLRRIPSSHRPTVR